MEEKNKQLVKKGFDSWASGGSFFDLLSDEVEWTIAGTSSLSKTYHGKKEFIDQAMNKVNEKLKGKIVPTLESLYADGDMVVAVWYGKATTTLNQPYNNRYVWLLTVKDYKIVKALVFLDTLSLAKVLGQQ